MTEPTDAERIAKAFHDEYEHLAPHYHYETRKESAVPWDDVPANNKSLMINVAVNLIENGTIPIAELEALRAFLLWTKKNHGLFSIFRDEVDQYIDRLISLYDIQIPEQKDT